MITTQKTDNPQLFTFVGDGDVEQAILIRSSVR